ncbi:conserved hypothetical protein [Methylocella tundrae]|uniref:Uncharacterized protein n=1 Tax=Methylocella tundrae TaxID=227605 RepID=A0A8B6M8X5_METTU|nr:hypothetical protein [Methylocella tundrae]VTZ51360.1 conserved hypothetical protein [Methylocella tundrae]
MGARVARSPAFFEHGSYSLQVGLGAMVDVVLCSTGNGGLLTVGAEVGALSDGDYPIKGLKISVAGVVVSASFDVEASKISIPEILLKGPQGGSFQLKTTEDIATDVSGDAVRAARSRIRKALTQPLKAKGSFFGADKFFNNSIEITIRLDPAAILQESASALWVMRVEATAAVKWTVRLGDDGAQPTLDANAQARFSAEIGQTGPFLSFLLARADQLAFALRLPAVPFPTLSLAGLAFDLAEPPALADLGLPNLTMAWTTAPKLTLSITNGDLAFRSDPAGAGTIKVGGQAIADMTDLTIAGNQNGVALSGRLTSKNASLSIDEVIDAPDIMPFRIELKDVTATPSLTVNNGTVSVVTTFDAKRIEIRAKSDPSMVLAFRAKAIITAATGGPNAQINELALIEPTPVELVRATNAAAGRFIRLLGALPTAASGGVAPLLLQRLSAMTAAALDWIAGHASGAAKELAGVAESAALALGRILDFIGSAPAASLPHVVVEARLDPRDYHIRQLIVTPLFAEPPTTLQTMSAAGFDIAAPLSLQPCLMIDFGPPVWFGLVVKSAAADEIKISTDLWLAPDASPAQPLSDLSENGGRPSDRLIAIKAKKGSNKDIALVAIRNGALAAFQSLPTAAAAPATFQLGGTQVTLAPLTENADFGRLTFGAGADIAIDIDASQAAGRILPMFRKLPSAESLEQKVKVTGFDHSSIDDDCLVVSVMVEIALGDFTTDTAFDLKIDLATLNMSIASGKTIKVKSKNADPLPKKKIADLDLQISRKPGQAAGPYGLFEISFANDDFTLSKSGEAIFEIAYGGVAGEGGGVKFDIANFAVGRGGLDLEARVLPEPVMLAGVMTPFRFTEGDITISKGRFTGGTLKGSGPLPPDLIGEANAEVSLSFATRGAGSSPKLYLQSSTGSIQGSKGKPLISEGTRFHFELLTADLKFLEQDGGYHFYFELTGSAAFRPRAGEFSSGLLKNLSAIEIKFEKAPLTKDPAVLLNRLEFLVKLDPPEQTRCFDIFDFELRGIGFHPAAPVFEGAPPAMMLAGQVKFGLGDVVSPRFDFHKMWIAVPDAKHPQPRVRFDGLTLGLKVGSTVDIEGTAMAVDDEMPSLWKPGVVPSNVSAKGFLAAGRLTMKGFAPLSAAMGFLEMRRTLPDGSRSAPRDAFFLYGDKGDLSEPIPTPIGDIYLRRAGFGFGYRYTLAGIAAAETADTPQKLVQVLDDISKYQGSLSKLEAWTPTFDNAGLTLALSGLFTLTSASKSDAYNAEKERDLANPLLFDIVAALRTDLTFLMNVRCWLCYNYADWREDPQTASWKDAPTARGYLYLSVPRREFLGRFISDSKGAVGEHPPLSAPLKTAIASSYFAATLYIRPGLFHFELGWPYELQTHFGDPNGDLYIEGRAGLIFRVEDSSFVYGVALKLTGFAKFEGGGGGGSFGAIASARADFAVEAKLIAYVSLGSPGDTMFYGAIQLDVCVSVSVRVWLEISLPFGHHIHLEFGFSLGLSVSVAIEAVVLVKDGIGGRAAISVGVQAFGRTLTLGVSLSFNDGALATARARVQRFLTMGLGAETPSIDGYAKPPLPEPSRELRAKNAAEAINTEAARAQTEINAQANRDKSYKDATDQNTGTIPRQGVAYHRPKGEPIGPTAFTALLFPTMVGEKDDWYVMQLLPREDEPAVELGPAAADRASFFCSPPAPAPNGDREPRPKYHTVSFDAAPSAGLLWCPAPDPPTACTQATQTLNTDIIVAKQVADQKDSAALKNPITLEHFLWDCFMGVDAAAGANGAFTEPVIKSYAPSQRLPDDERVSANTLADAGRARATATFDIQVAAEVGERRSALLASIVDSASAIAAAGFDAGKVSGHGLDRLDARLFGLTFLVSQEALLQLFPDADKAGAAGPQAGRFSVEKNDCQGKSYKVELFNPPPKMFRAASPILSAQRIEISDNAVRLDWDLEPAWSRSTSLFHDPEHHLKHYRVRRVVTGFHDNYEAEFLVKPAASIGPKNGAGHHELFRPAWQFVDDLTQPLGMPAALREALLGRLPFNDWTAAVNDAGKVGDIRLDYTVVPVDFAGTSDLGWPIGVDVATPAQHAPAPARARLTALFDRMARLPSAAAPQPELALELDLPREMIVDAGSRATHAAKLADLIKAAERLILKWRPERVVAGGLYGSDAVGETNRRPDQQAMEAVKPGDEIFELRIAGSDDGAKGSLPGTLTFLGGGGGAAERTSEDARLVFETKSRGELEKLMTSTDGELKARRLFLKRVRGKNGENGASPWIGCELEIAYKSWKPDGVNDAKMLKNARCVEAVVETYEYPAHYDFDALDFADLHAECGRVYHFTPKSDARLATPDAELLSDPLRRCAVRLQINAAPTKIEPPEGITPARLKAMVAGFDLFSLDVEALPRDVQAADYPRYAAPLGRLTLLAPHLRGSEPSEFGDFAKIEARYPSDWARFDGAAPNGPNLWFSAAESFLLVPPLVLRRTLIPLPDDSAIAELLLKGQPTEIHVEVVGMPANLQWSLGLAQQDDNKFTQADGGTGKPPIFRKTHAGPLTTEDLRQLLPLIVLDDAGDLDQTFAKSPHDVGAVSIKIDVSVPIDNATLRLDVPVSFAFDPAIRLHPVLADTIDFLRCEQDTTIRRYEPVADPDPPADAVGLAAWIDATPPERDPLGWGALRTLGLAAGLRLFDTELGAFVQGGDFALLVRQAFDKALKRYKGLFCGAPFVDFIFDPENAVSIESFDGLAKERPFDQNNAVALVQIALRPLSDHVGKEFNSHVDPTTKYYSLEIGAPTELTASAGFIVDVIEQPSGFVAPIRRRLSAAAGSTDAEKEKWRSRLLAADDARLEKAEISGPQTLLLRVFASRDAAGLGFSCNPACAPDEVAAPPLRGNSSQVAARNPFQQFGDLPAAWRADTLFAATEGPDDAAQEPLLSLRRRAALRLPQAPTAKQAPTEDELRSVRSTFAERLAHWSQRFFDKGVGDFDAPAAPRYSIGVIALPAAVAKAADEDGRLGVMFLEKDRFGRRRRYAARPFCRYDAFSRSVPVKAGAATPLFPANGLEGAFGDPKDPRRANENWADVVLARSEPAPKPVILAAKRVADKVGHGGFLEIIVARPAEDMLREVNMVTDAGISSRGIRVGLRREYPNEAWATARNVSPDAEGFGAKTMVSDPAFPSLISDGLFDLAGDAPDAWLGALVYRFRALPYFFRIRADVHYAAGVVVSEASTATFEEGFYGLRWPEFKTRNNAAQIAPAAYAVTRDSSGQLTLAFSIPLPRHLDCMLPEDLKIWFGAERAADVNVTNLLAIPDPEVSFRIAIQTETGQSRVAEAEILLKDVQSRDPYDVQQTGPRFAAFAWSTHLTSAAGDFKITTLTVSASCSPAARPAATAPKPVPDDPDALLQSLAGLVVAPAAAAEWARIAPSRAVKLSISKPPADAQGNRNWAALDGELVQAIATFAGYGTPAVQAIVAALQQVRTVATGANPDATWNAQLGGDPYQITISKMSFALPGLVAGLTMISLVPAGPWSWDETLAGNVADRKALYEGFATAVHRPAADNSADRLRWAEALRNHYVARLLQEVPDVVGGLAPARELIKVSEIQPYESVGWPAMWSGFDLVRTWRYDPKAAATAADLFALETAIEAYIAAQHSHAAPEESRLILALAGVEDSLLRMGPPLAGFALDLTARAAADAPIDAALSNLAVRRPLVAASAVLRQPPTDAELALLKAAAADDVFKTFKGLADEQLFGRRRSPVILAFKGTAQPISCEPIGRP